MPITLKQGQILYKKNNGQYQGIDTIAQRSTTQMISQIQAAGTSTITQVQTTGASTITQVQGKINQLQTNFNTIKDSIQSALENGTDTTLTQSGVAADAKAAGDAIDDLKSALSDISKDGYTLNFTISDSRYQLGFRTGRFVTNTGASDTSGSYSRATAPISSPEYTEKIYLKNNTAGAIYIVVFTSPTPSYATSGDNSEIYKKSLDPIPSNGEGFITVEEGEYYFVWLNKTYTNLTEQDVPTMIAVTSIQNKVANLSDDISGLKHDVSNEKETIAFVTSDSFSLGFRAGYFSNSGVSSASANYSRTAFALNVAPGNMIKVTPKSNATLRITAYSSAPSFSNNADNSSLLLWYQRGTSPMFFRAVAGELYYVDIDVAFAGLTSDNIPIVEQWAWIAGEVERLDYRVDTAEDTTNAVSEDMQTRIVDGYLQKVDGDFALLCESKKFTSADEYDVGQYTISMVDGYPVASLTQSSNYKNSKKISCPVGGLLKFISSFNFNINFFNGNDIVYKSRSAIQAGTNFIPAYGDSFTIEINSSSGVTVPEVYYAKDWSGVVPVTEYVTEENALYDKVFADVDSNTIVLATVADTHYCEYETRGYQQRKIADDFVRIAKNCGVDVVLHLGDMYDSEYWTSGNSVYANELHARQMVDIYRKYGTPFAYTQGHHELWPHVSSGDGTNVWGFSRERCFGLLGRYCQVLNPKFHGESSSFYIDFDYSKVRLIVLDGISWSANGFSTSVVNWYDNVLSSTPTGYGVIIASHQAPIVYGSVGVTQGDLIKNKTLTYIANGGNVLCHLHGHYHKDNYNIITDGTNSYPLISLAAQTVDATSTTPTDGMEHFNPTTTRAQNGYTKYLFDIICVHRDTGAVKGFRFGAGNDLVLTRDGSGYSGGWVTE